MAAPMRSSSQEAGHRARVADSSTSSGINATAKPSADTSTTSTNFEYDDNEWDIGIGDLIIDLDADIEKTTEKTIEALPMAANTAGPQASKAAAAKMAVEHSATVDKGLKMKIKRTKPGTKTSEAKHEIVKSNEQNGVMDPADMKGGGGGGPTATKHPISSSGPLPANANVVNSQSSKRGSSGHRRDKTREKHGGGIADKQQQPPAAAASGNVAAAPPSSAGAAISSGGKVNVVAPSSGGVNVTDMNGMVRVSAPQIGAPRPVFPASTGPGPPQVVAGPSPGPPPSPAAATAPGSAAKPEQAKVGAQTTQSGAQANLDDRSSTASPPLKKIKSENKDVTDVCVGTSVGTITEPDCLGPCEPGTSVTLEGIVWHETEGGVLVVNVTWRGKTYVGTLLDCTRHDWAPPRFCDSPTSDLDNRTPKGRETRSSVHSKLRNGGVKGRRGAANGTSGTSTAPSSPTPFVPPRPEPGTKRKVRTEEESSCKKTKVIVPPPTPPPVVAPATPTPLSTPCTSPPPSPVLLECPEPNCSKKYKHINGLKYHQSHAHGSVDDDDTKDVTSMSENDESNIEAPSPVTPVKSPEKCQDSPVTPQKKDDMPSLLRGTGLLEVPSQPTTPRSTPPSPVTPQSLQDLGTAGSPTVPIVVDAAKNVVKPGVLRYTAPEDYPVFANKAQMSQGAPISNSGPLPAVRSVPQLPPAVDQTISKQQQDPAIQPQSFSSQLQSQVNMPSQQFTQPPSLMIPPQNTQQTSQLSPRAPPSPSQGSKITQFKVKPTAALMPDEKKPVQATVQQGLSNHKPQGFKKKSRKSPAGSPLPPQTEPPVFGVEQPPREEVQSPAYSDISDDGAPLEPEVSDKSKVTDKKTEPGQPLPHMPQYGMYSFYGQPQYLVPSVQQQTPETKPKETEKSTVDKPGDKEKKELPEYQQKVVPQQPQSQPQQHYYPYGGYIPGYPYNLEPNYSTAPGMAEEKIKEERVKESPSPIDQSIKQPTPIPNPIQVPTPGKVKQEPQIKDKHQNENHQILKESIEIKNQMNPYMYPRQQMQQQSQQPPSSHHSQREEDVRRFYVYEQRRKEQQQQQSMNEQHKSSNTPSKAPPPQSPTMKPHKEVKVEDKKEKEVKQEGVKPTMETQGPPPPPTSQYAYIHPGYMQSAHYGALPFDPNHPMYRGIMVPGPYSTNPYIHAQIPRYHAPEDLSRPPQSSKALDMLQHHAQYYSSHKIHELQERAIKSPTPKTSIASSSPSANSGPPSGPPPQMTAPPISQSSNSTPSSGGKQTPGDNKESRSPPPQRHVHTHHHTHVGLGYPMYPAPYGAAVLASQQAAAVTVINPYPK